MAMRFAIDGLAELAGTKETQALSTTPIMASKDETMAESGNFADRQGAHSRARQAASTKTNLTEIEIERAGLRVRVGRGVAAVAAPVVNVTGSASVVSAAAAPGDPAKHPGAVTSPMVGTAYMGSQPRAPSRSSTSAARFRRAIRFSIIEAMKTMNQIPATRSGTVTKIQIEDAPAGRSSANR